MPQLRVVIVNGINLPAMDTGGTSDPYCRLEVGNQAVKSKTIHKTLNPNWNETFTFNVHDPSREALKIFMYDYDVCCVV